MTCGWKAPARWWCVVPTEPFSAASVRELDVVALPDGRTGTVVSPQPDGAYTVEVSDTQGRTLDLVNCGPPRNTSPVVGSLPDKQEGREGGHSHAAFFRLRRDIDRMLSFFMRGSAVRRVGCMGCWRLGGPVGAEFRSAKPGTPMPAALQPHKELGSCVG
jgi:hypothetical protein